MVAMPLESQKCRNALKVHLLLQKGEFYYDVMLAPNLSATCSVSRLLLWVSI